MKLILEYEADSMSVTAVIINGSAGAVHILDNVYINPCVLELTDSSGKPVESFDEREIMKYNTTPESFEYKEVKPGAKYLVRSAKFEKRSPGMYRLQWGTYKFENIKPGNYTVIAHWPVEDVPEGKFDTWKEKLHSEAIPAVLP